MARGAFEPLAPAHLHAPAEGAELEERAARAEGAVGAVALALAREAQLLVDRDAPARGAGAELRAGALRELHLHAAARGAERALRRAAPARAHAPTRGLGVDGPVDLLDGDAAPGRARLDAARDLLQPDRAAGGLGADVAPDLRRVDRAAGGVEGHPPLDPVHVDRAAAGLGVDASLELLDVDATAARLDPQRELPRHARAHAHVVRGEDPPEAFRAPAQVQLVALTAQLELDAHARRVGIDLDLVGVVRLHVDGSHVELDVERAARLDGHRLLQACGMGRPGPRAPRRRRQCE